MAEPTLQDIFGAGATQDANAIHILKSDLPMTAAGINRGEQVYAAIVKKASATLTPANFASNLDQSIVIAQGFDSLAYRSVSGVQTSYFQTQLTTNFAKIQTSAGVTPDDY